MASFLFNSFVIALVAGFSSGYNHGRIVGGNEISIEEAPYQISIQVDGAHACGGSIISPTYIITAAHCGDHVSLAKLSVRAGSSIRESGGQVVNVTAIHNHPRYIQAVSGYDISIFELASPLVFGKSVAPIELPSENQTWPAGTEVFVTGWGLLNEYDDNPPINLHGVTVEIIDEESCRAVYYMITSSMLCAGVNGGGKDACEYDSGGPLAVNGVLGGIVSVGVGCAEPKYPGIYTFVPAFRDFIRNITGL